MFCNAMWHTYATKALYIFLDAVPPHPLIFAPVRQQAYNIYHLHYEIIAQN